MNEYRPPSFRLFPPVVKNLLIANFVVFLAGFILKGTPISWYMSLHYFPSEYFHVYQPFTYMFVHAGFDHIFFNMFGLWMFGNVLENYWGSRRFLIFYLICGVGAAFTQETAQYFSFHNFNHAIEVFNAAPSNAGYSEIIGKYFLSQGYAITDLHSINLSDRLLEAYQLRMDTWMCVGASGAIFGVLLAFAMNFPNTELFFIFLPIPIKAKYAIAVYGLWELFSGIANRPGDNIGHYAHLGGMLFGFILILYWKKKRI